MPAINVTLKEGASAEELDNAKKSVQDQGGKVTHEFKLIKGFTPGDKIPACISHHYNRKITITPLPKYMVVRATDRAIHHSAEFPEGTVHSLATNEHVTVEADQVVKTQ
ncbi:putative peptidase inhibitor i9 protein [Lasiodiplodia theobromae]|nr:putative peptidase inhibitor i9 protein [Lasiodiplodia theobromae]